MAFLTRRAPWLVGLAALAILAAYLPPQRPPEPKYRGQWQDYPTPESRLAKRLGDDYRIAARHARVLSERDSLMRVLASRPRRLGTIMALGRAGKMDSAARVIVREGAPLVPALSHDVQTVFALVPNSTWGDNSNTYLPLATDGQTCLIVLATNADFHHTVPRGSHFRDDFGPCAFVAAFGKPGSEVGAWLESRAYDLALQSDWTLPPHPIQTTDEPQLSTWLSTTFAHLAGRVGPYDEWDFAGPYWQSLGLVGCAAGKVDACHRYFFSPLRDQLRYSIPGVSEGNFFYPDYTGRVMASLVRDQGPERFARFWRSPLPPEQAFDAAFTVPFDQWAMSWTRARVGRIQVGAATSVRDFVSSL
ncbi:MAG TPA: hypothetical protein VJS20_02470, partial [Gemmatimonadales bacterium]|nr:hypothetical protein [Gemmatimonadales bacterium]